jgi:hypothetical protein
MGVALQNLDNATPELLGRDRAFDKTRKEAP